MIREEVEMSPEEMLELTQDALHDARREAHSNHAAFEREFQLRDAAEIQNAKLEGMLEAQLAKNASLKRQLTRTQARLQRSTASRHALAREKISDDAAYEDLWEEHQRAYVQLYRERGNVDALTEECGRLEVDCEALGALLDETEHDRDALVVVLEGMRNYIMRKDYDESTVLLAALFRQQHASIARENKGLQSKLDTMSRLVVKLRSRLVIATTELESAREFWGNQAMRINDARIQAQDALVECQVKLQNERARHERLSREYHLQTQSDEKHCMLMDNEIQELRRRLLEIPVLKQKIAGMQQHIDNREFTPSAIMLLATSRRNARQ